MSAAPPPGPAAAERRRADARRWRRATARPSWRCSSAMPGGSRPIAMRAGAGGRRRRRDRAGRDGRGLAPRGELRSGAGRRPRPGSSPSRATGASTHFRRAGRPAPDPADPLFQPDPAPDGFAALTPPSARRGCATALGRARARAAAGARRRLLRGAEPRRDRRARGAAARHGEVADPARLPPPACDTGRGSGGGVRRWLTAVAVPMVEVWRGNVAESHHRGHAVDLRRRRAGSSPPGATRRR